MRRGLGWLALAGLLAAVPLWARQHVPAAAAPRSSQAAQSATTPVVRQRDEVQRLQREVAAQESGSRAAAQRLSRRDAEIAELRRQLQAVRQAAPATDTNR